MSTRSAVRLGIGLAAGVSLLAMADPAAADVGGWSIATTPQSGLGNDSLNAVGAASDSEAWAVGRNGRFGPQLVARWNGSAWSTVTAAEPDPANPGANATLTAVSAPSGDDVWAVGQFSDISGTAAYALYWNGASWTSTQLVAGAGNLPSSVVALGPNDVWATVNTQNGGNAYIQHWNGSSWSVAASRPATEYPTLAGITARGATDVWAVGGFLGNINTPTPTREVRTLHWDGTSWTVVSAPNGGGAQMAGAATIPGGNRVWAAGTATGSFILTRTT